MQGGGEGSAQQCVTRSRPTEDAEMRRYQRFSSWICSIGSVALRTSWRRGRLK